MHHHRRTTAVRAMAFMLGLVIATGIVLGFSSKSDVHAENTAQILEAARQRQASLDAQIQELQQQSDQLAANQTQANAKLNWLNDRSAEQKALYAAKNEQLKEATKTMAAANKAFIDASENLAYKKGQYRARLQTMFSHRNKSYFQIFVEAGNLKNFFTTIQFMSLVAESDKAMIDDLRTAADNAELQQREAEQAREDMAVIIGQINAQIERIKKEQNVTLAELDSIQIRLSRADSNEEDLNSESNRLDGEIAALQKKLTDEQIARAAAERAAIEKAAAEKAAAARAAAEKAAAEKAAAERAAAEQAAAEKAAAEQAARARAEAERTEAARIAAERAAAERAAAEQAAAQKAAAERAAAEQAAARAAAERAAAEKAAALRASTANTNSRGWVWPYPGDRKVYSPYGWRIHPVYRVRKFHTGVDLGGDYGAPILAARDGVVVFVRNTWNGQNTGGTGYGNYVIIAHSGGYTTLYAHLKNVLVREGQAVNAGDRIATCGSTGTSTAPHLHFEVRVNGSTVDPLPYIR